MLSKASKRQLSSESWRLSCFWGSPVDYILWWTLCINSGFPLIHLPPREGPWSVKLLWMGGGGVDSPGKAFFCNTPKLFAVVFRVFWFSSLMTPRFTDSGSSLSSYWQVTGTDSKCKRLKNSRPFTCFNDDGIRRGSNTILHEIALEAVAPLP